MSTAGASAVGREWISPRCVLTSTKGVVRVPVINLGTNALGWRRTRGLWKVTAVMEEEIETLREEDNPGVIGAVQESALSETIPSCSSWKDVNVRMFDRTINCRWKKRRIYLLFWLSIYDVFLKQKEKLIWLSTIETGQSPPLHSVPYRVSEKKGLSSRNMWRRC